MLSVSECEVGQAALRAQVVQMWSTHNSATAAQRPTVYAGQQQDTVQARLALTLLNHARRNDLEIPG
jgi:hypothetical protein